MRTDLRSSILWLGPNQLLELRDARGRVLTSVLGTLWATQQDDPRDLTLAAGESVRLDRDGVTLVQAVQGAAYLLVEEGVHARLIDRDGHAETLLAPAAAAPDAPAWTATELHEWARTERARLLGDLIAAAVVAGRDAAHAAGRRVRAAFAAAGRLPSHGVAARPFATSR